MVKVVRQVKAVKQEVDSMGKFRKKPIVIEAEQYAPNMEVLPKGVTEESTGSDLTGHISAYVITIHLQKCYIQPGDWIIPEPDGIHYYPVKPDIFAATYEAVDR